MPNKKPTKEKEEREWREQLMDKFCVMFERAQDESCVERLESFISTVESNAVEREREGLTKKILDLILSEEIEMQVGDNINELLEYRGIEDCGKSMRGGAKEKVIKPLVVRILSHLTKK